MVILKSKISEPSVMPAEPVATRWHLKSGKLNAAGTKLKTRIAEYLEEQEAHVGYSQIRDHLVVEFEKDYNRDGSSDKVLNNYDIKIIVAEMVKDGDVVDE